MMALFPNLSGIAVRSPLINSLFSYATANNVQHLFARGLSLSRRRS